MLRQGLFYVKEIPLLAYDLRPFYVHIFGAPCSFFAVAPLSPYVAAPRCFRRPVNSGAATDLSLGRMDGPIAWSNEQPSLPSDVKKVHMVIVTCTFPLTFIPPILLLSPPLSPLKPYVHIMSQSRSLGETDIYVRPLHSCPSVAAPPAAGGWKLALLTCCRNFHGRRNCPHVRRARDRARNEISTFELCRTDGRTRTS